MSQRISGGEGAISKAREPVVDGRASVTILINRKRQRAFQCSSHGLAGTGLNVYGEERSPLIPGIRHKPFSRAVHDLPVAEISPSAEADCAGADSAQGESDPLEVVLVIALENRPCFILAGVGIKA